MALRSIQGSTVVRFRCMRSVCLSGLLGDVCLRHAGALSVLAHHLIYGLVHQLYLLPLNY